jgi:predicted nucleotidyltransferase
MLSLEDQAKIIAVLLPYEPEYIGVFGSVARGEDGPESDVDILTVLKDGYSYFDLIDLERALKKALRKKVDLVTERSLKPRSKPRILRDLSLFYGQRND